MRETTGECCDELMGGVTGPAISLLLAELLIADARPKLMRGRSSSAAREYVAMSCARQRGHSKRRRTESSTPIVGVSRPLPARTSVDELAIEATDEDMAECDRGGMTGRSASRLPMRGFDRLPPTEVE